MPVFPPSGGGGGGGGPWYSNSVVYVSPSGSDGTPNGSNASTPFKTAYEAYRQVIVPAGGGTMYIASGTYWGGPVTAQGMWIRGDGLSVTGWLPFVPTKFVGVGPVSETPFMPVAMAYMYVGSNDPADFRTKPGIWFTRTQSAAWEFENIMILPTPGHTDSQYALYRGIRIGWDYNRNENGSIMYQPVLSGVRVVGASDGSTTVSNHYGATTFTVGLAPDVAAVSASRTSGIVTLTIPRPGVVKSPPWGTTGTPFWFASTAGAFPSGAYSLINTNAVLTSDADWSLTYTDNRVFAHDPTDGVTNTGTWHFVNGNFTSADIGSSLSVSGCNNAANNGTRTILTVVDSTHVTTSATGLITETFGAGVLASVQLPNVGATSNPGAVRSIVCNPSDFIDLESNNAQFPSTQYTVLSSAVTSSTTGTVTVLDIWGGYNGVNVTQGSTSLAGSQIAHHERGFNASYQIRFKACAARSCQDPTKIYSMGPTVDIGGALAGFPVLDGCYFEGFKPHSSQNQPYDSARMVAFLVWGGQACSGGVLIRNTNGSQTGCRVFTTGYFGIDNVIWDSANGQSPAAYDIQAGTPGIIYLNNISTSDASVGYGAYLNQINSDFPAQYIGGNSVLGKKGGAIGPSNNRIGQIDPSRSPWIDLQIGAWADQQITGKHPAAWRNNAPVTPRFRNLISPSGWTFAADATGIADPFGGTGAVQWSDTIHGPATGTPVRSGADAITSFAAGGHYVVGGWFNCQSGAFFPSYLWEFVSNGDLVWESTGTGTWAASISRPGDGWQFMYHSERLISGSASQSYSLICSGPASGSGKVSQWFGQFAFWAPPSFSDNDIAEYVGTLRAQPYYLLPGMAGTFEGQKFIAHGGLGTAKRYTVGGASGQITVGAAAAQAIEVFDESGNSLGVIRPNAFTVNP